MTDDHSIYSVRHSTNSIYREIKKNSVNDTLLREGPPEDHPTRIGARRRKFFFSILLPQMKDFD
jgi:hypothetical protein